MLFTTLNPPNSQTADVINYCQTIPGSAPRTQSNNNQNISPRSGLRGGVNAVFADGSLRFVSDSVTTGWTDAGIRVGGEVAGDF